MKRCLFAAIFFVIASSVFAADNPPAGGDDIYRFYSPRFLAEGPSSVSLLSPQADAVNPAASGEQQRMTFDLSYLALADFAGGGAYGQIVNAGISMPSRIGVTSASLHFLSLPFGDELNLGTLGTLHVSFAKDLFPDLLVGAGVHLIFGKQTRSSFAAGLDLGFIHMPGDIGFMKDFRWGGVLRNMGTAYKPIDDTIRSFPSLFTPALGASFTAVRTQDLDLSVTGDLSFPAFQNVVFKVGSGITFRNFISFETSLNLNIDDLSNAPAPSLVPSIGFSVNLDRKGKSGTEDDAWKNGELNIQTAAAPLYGSIWAFGAGANMPVGIIDSNPPVISVDYPNVQYVSPNHDGRNDDLEFPLSIRDERFIKGYRFVVVDENGSTVREIYNKEERPENTSFKNIIDRVTYVKTGIPVPEAIHWDGTMDSGSLVEDGTYTFFIEAWDDNGNNGRTNACTVVVDTAAPRVDLKVPASPDDLIFSPNSDGNKDSFPIVQNGTKEDLWEGKILDASGLAVKAFTWKNDGPASFPWDGKNLEGILAPDGVYSYMITSTDRAGNSVEKRLDNIIINTQQPPIGLSITKAFFSPNGDGVQDEIQLVPDVPVKSGIVNWTVSIQDAAGKLVKTSLEADQLSAPVPEGISFDGFTNDGTVLSEGGYRAVLSVLYQNGHHPTAVSPYFTLDITPPSARVSANYTVFSPNGDGRKETVTVYQDSSREDVWTGRIVNASGETVKRLEWKEKADADFSWDGRGDDRKILSDGRYGFILEATDRAGNSGTSELLPITIDTLETPVALSTQDDAFLPNGDGLKDRLDIIPQIKVNEGIEQWELSVFNENGALVIVQKSARKDDISFWWDGISNTGLKSPDGRYYAQLTLRYANGNEPTAKTGLFLLDTLAPRADVAANYTVFSPNGDGKKDEIVFAQETSKEARWIATIISSRGMPVKSFTWIGEADRNVTWDGRGDDKLVQPDGQYMYRLASIDLAGNKGSAADIRFEINTEETPLFLSAEFDAFSPNGDGIKDKIRLLPQVKVTEGYLVVPAGYSSTAKAGLPAVSREGATGNSRSSGTASRTGANVRLTERTRRCSLCFTRTGTLPRLKHRLSFSIRRLRKRPLSPILRFSRPTATGTKISLRSRRKQAEKSHGRGVSYRLTDAR